jgi:glucosyl-3-phosphoglycerate phosphatase
LEPAPVEPGPDAGPVLRPAPSTVIGWRLSVCPDAVCQDVCVGRLLVVRHAQSVWNAAGRWQGWSDAPLSELGVDQARLAGQALAEAGVVPELVAASDLARARVTAELIAFELEYEKPLVVEPDLREQDLGEWNGLTNEEISTRWPEQFLARRAGQLGTVPGGEPGDDFFRRSVGALRRLAGGGAEVAVVVAHGGVVIALEKALGVSAKGSRHPNLSGWWLEVRGSHEDLDLVPLERVDLLALGAETVTGHA